MVTAAKNLNQEAWYSYRFQWSSEISHFNLWLTRGNINLRLDFVWTGKCRYTQQLLKTHNNKRLGFSEPATVFFTPLSYSLEVIHLVNIKQYVPTIDLYPCGCVINPPTRIFICIAYSNTGWYGEAGRRRIDLESKSRSFVVERQLWMKTTIHGKRDQMV